MRFLFLSIAAISGCSEFDAGKYAPDPGVAPGEAWPDDADTGLLDGPEAIDCNDAPRLDWINFGESFFVQNCNGCHHSNTPDRYGAPDYAFFDTADDVWDKKALVLATAGGDNPSMPPNGGTTVEDRAKLEIWLTCGELGN